jgi:hypothetical protein
VLRPDAIVDSLHAAGGVAALSLVRASHVKRLALRRALTFSLFRGSVLAGQDALRLRAGARRPQKKAGLTARLSVLLRAVS